MKTVQSVAVILSFLSGAILGGDGLSYVDEINVKYVFEFGSYLATILVALVGVKTMNAWQAQFKHSEKYKAIRAFQASLEKSVIREAYIKFLMGKTSELLFENGEEDLREYLTVTQDNQKDAIANSFDVGRCWENMVMLLDESDKRLFSCSPYDVDARVGRTVSRIYGVAFGRKPEEWGELVVETSQFSIAFERDIAELNKISNLIIKKMVG